MGSNKSTKRYSLGDVNTVIGPLAAVLPPVDLSGYGSDGAIEFDIQEDLQNMVVGLDGAVAFSENLNESVVATITLLETTSEYRQLGAMAQRQVQLQKTQAGLFGVNFLMIDPGNGDKVQEDQAVFTSIPGPDKGGDASDRSFSIALPHARPDIIFGGLNLI